MASSNDLMRLVFLVGLTGILCRISCCNGVVQFDTMHLLDEEVRDVREQQQQQRLEDNDLDLKPSGGEDEEESHDSSTISTTSTKTLLDVLIDEELEGLLVDDLTFEVVKEEKREDSAASTPSCHRNLNSSTSSSSSKEDEEGDQDQQLCDNYCRKNQEEFGEVKADELEPKQRKKQLNKRVKITIITTDDNDNVDSSRDDELKESTANENEANQPCLAKKIKTDDVEEESKKQPRKVTAKQNPGKVMKTTNVRVVQHEETVQSKQAALPTSMNGKEKKVTVKSVKKASKATKVEKSSEEGSDEPIAVNDYAEPKSPGRNPKKSDPVVVGKSKSDEKKPEVVGEEDETVVMEAAKKSGRKGSKKGKNPSFTPTAKNDHQKSGKNSGGADPKPVGGNDHPNGKASSSKPGRNTKQQKYTSKNIPQAPSQKSKASSTQKHKGSSAQSSKQAKPTRKSASSAGHNQKSSSSSKKNSQSKQNKSQRKNAQGNRIDKNEKI